MLASETRIDDLEKAWLGIRTTIEKIDGRQAELKERLDAVQKFAQQLTEQKASAEKQLEVLKKDKRHTLETQALIGDLNALMRSQAQRGEMLGRLQTGYLDLIARVGEARQGCTGKKAGEPLSENRQPAHQLRMEKHRGRTETVGGTAS